MKNTQITFRENSVIAQLGVKPKIKYNPNIS